MAISDRREHLEITAPPENVCERYNTLHMLNMNDETRNKMPDEVSELSVPATHFDRQPHTHHTDENVSVIVSAFPSKAPTKVPFHLLRQKYNFPCGVS